MSTTPQQPSLPPPSAAPPNRAIWWVLGILGGLVVLLLVGGTIFGTYLLRTIRIEKNAQRVEISTPLGKMEVQKGGLHTTGLPVYPQAVPARDDAQANIDLSFLGTQALNIAAEKYVTSDPLEKVRAWYTGQLGSDYHLEKPGSQEFVRWGQRKIPIVVSNPGEVVFVDDRGEDLKIVAIKPALGATRIDLVRMGKKEIQ